MFCKLMLQKLTSTGIDDNATSTAITIDVNDNVGIGVVPESGWGSTAEALQLGTSFGALWSINKFKCKFCIRV